MTHAASSRFLDRVRRRLEGRPQDYSDFLNIMRVLAFLSNLLNDQKISFKELKSESLNINCAIAEICRLFQVTLILLRSPTDFK